ncbi:MAG: response regulator [Nitrospirota bacterium]
MSILIVEDNQVSAKILEIILQKHGYQTIVATTGKEALEFLKNTISIQLVIADIMMPEMNGLDLVRTMKESREWKEIPVIMSTSLADAQTVSEAVKLGCRHYVLKPVNAANLMPKVHEALTAEIPVIRNRYLIMSELGLDSIAYEELARSLATQISEKIQHLKQMDTSGKHVENVQSEVLDLAESSMVLGAERVKSIMERLDAKGKRDAETMRSFYPLLLVELELFHNALMCLLNPQGHKK